MSVQRSQMSGEPDQHTEAAQPAVGVPAPTSRLLRAEARRESSLDGRLETQLRARIADLEAQLIEVARCLNAAEAHAASLQDEVDRAWGTVTMMADSKSWRYTTALRSVIGRVRRLL